VWRLLAAHGGAIGDNDQGMVSIGQPLSKFVQSFDVVFGVPLEFKRFLFLRELC